MIGWGAHFQVSGLSKQEPGSGDQVQVRVQEIWPLTTVIDSALLFISGGGWKLRVAGGGTFPLSFQFSPPRSPPFSPPWSSAAARSARSADPTSSQCPEITKNDEQRTKNNPDSQPLTANR